MVTLLQSLFKLLFGEEKIEKTGSSIIKLFAIPLISLIVFILFVMVVLPKMS